MRLASLRTPPRSGTFTPVRSSTSGRSTPSGQCTPGGAGPGGAAFPAMPGGATLGGLALGTVAGHSNAAKTSSRPSSRGVSTPNRHAHGRVSPSGATTPTPDLFGREAKPASGGAFKIDFPARTSSTGTTCSHGPADAPETPASARATPAAAEASPPPLNSSGGAPEPETPRSPGVQAPQGEPQTPRRRYTLSHARGRAGELPSSPRLRQSSDKQQRSHGHLCVCEICTCGMHKCHHTSHTAHFEGDTTSRSFHCAHPLPAQPSRARSSEKTAQPRRPFEGESTYKVDYNEKALPERAAVPAPCFDSLPFDGATSYRDNFTEKRVEIEPRQEPQPKPRQPFCGETSYKHFHSEKPLQPSPPRERSAPARKNLQSCPGQRRRFEGESSYVLDFQAKPIPEQHRPAQVNYASLPFEGESSYKREYTKKSVPPDAPPPPQKKQQQPFYGETTYMHSHGQKPLPQGPSRARSAPAVPRSRPFEGASTYRSHYAELPSQPPPAEAARAPRTPRTVPDSRDFATTYGQHFVAKESPVCPITQMPHYPHYAPDGREHNFWNEDSSLWC